MPSRYSSPDSRLDVETLAYNLGIDLMLFPIEKAFQAYLDMLVLSLENNVPGVTEQNLQARVRANILFALSNRYGWMVLACSNKSELATGYGTLYGDTAGGFTILKDIYKTLVYKLANYKNLQAKKEVIPASILIKEPSAELAPNQKDTDTLPSYELLDPILKAYMDNHMSVSQIVAMGYNQEVVIKVANLVNKSEYKRRQSPPGVIISSGNSNFKGRLPISNSFTI
jgi:NAD+ synthase (glutamine-hydrolysing)